MLTLKDRENVKTVKMINRLLKQLRKESVKQSISIDNRSAVKIRLTKVKNDIIDKYRYDRRRDKILRLMGELES